MIMWRCVMATGGRLRYWVSSYFILIAFCVFFLMLWRVGGENKTETNFSFMWKEPRSSQCTGHPMVFPSWDVGVLYSLLMIHALSPVVTKALFLPFPAWEMRQGGKWALAGTKNVVSGVLLLFFPKSREELSGSQNEAAAQLLTQAPAIISHEFVFTNTQYSVCLASVLLTGNLLHHAISNCARTPLCSCSQRSLGNAAPLYPPCFSASCYHNCKSSVTLSGSRVPPTSLILTSSPKLGVPSMLKTALHSAFLPKRKEANRLGIIPSCVRGAAPHATVQDWASQHWVRGFREVWVLSLVPLHILALVPDEVLRLKPCCFPGFSEPTFQGSWQLVLLFTACFGVGSIYCCSLLYMRQVTLLQQLQLSSSLFFLLLSNLKVLQKPSTSPFP